MGHAKRELERYLDAQEHPLSEVVEIQTNNARTVVFEEWFHVELPAESDGTEASVGTSYDYWKVSDEDAGWLRRNRDGLLPLLLDDHELRAVHVTRYHAEDKR